MSIPTSFWCYCSHALRWKTGKEYSLRYKLGIRLPLPQTSVRSKSGAFVCKVKFLGKAFCACAVRTQNSPSLPVRTKKNEANAKHVHARWFVLICTLVCYLVRSRRFIHESMFPTQSIMLSPRFIPVERKNDQTSYFGSDIKLKLSKIKRTIVNMCDINICN